MIFSQKIFTRALVSAAILIAGTNLSSDVRAQECKEAIQACKTSCIKEAEECCKNRAPGPTLDQKIPCSAWEDCVSKCNFPEGVQCATPLLTCTQE